jgi:hypothetical protein
MASHTFLGFTLAACFLLGRAPAQAPQASGDDRRLAAALARLQPQRPGVTDAYLVVAALDSDPVFGREARETRRVLAARFGAEGRSIVLAEDEGGDRADAAGTPGNFELALAKAAALMDREEDVLVVYVTTHGTPRAGLNFKHAVHGKGFVTPKQFADSLARHGSRNRLIILQACYSGQFVPALAAPRTVVVTAASSMKPSFGCSPGNDWTFFGHALINLGMRSKDTLVRQIRRAVVTIIGWEQKLKIDPSRPQVSIGSETAGWLAALDARAGAVPPAPVGRPPSELGD